MKKPDRELGEDDIEIWCPFCKREVFHDYSGEDGFEDCDWDFCEHVVYANSWGVELWGNGGTLVQTGDEQLDEQVANEANDYEQMGERICKLMLTATPPGEKWELKHAGGYVERGMGPRGGGPTFTVVFRRKSPKQGTPAKKKKVTASTKPDRG